MLEKKCASCFVLHVVRMLFCRSEIEQPVQNQIERVHQIRLIFDFVLFCCILIRGIGCFLGSSETIMLVLVLVLVVGLMLVLVVVLMVLVAAAVVLAMLVVSVVVV